MQTTTKSREFSRAFTITESTLRNLWALLNEAGPGPGRLQFSCSDGSTIESDDLSTLLDFTNSDARRIQTVMFNGNYQSNVRIRVRMRGESTSSPKLDYLISGDDKNVAYISSRLEDVLGVCFAWYSRIIVPPLFAQFVATMTFMGGGFVTLFLGVVAIFDQPNKLQGLKLLGMPLSLALIAMGAVLLFLGSAGGKKLLHYLFPPASFEIGHGIQRSNRAAAVRRNLGGTLGLGIVGSLVASLIFGWF